MNEPKTLKTTGSTGGLVVITEKLPHVRSIALGVSYALGSRDDPQGQEGICHLIEHMVFKGTETMSGKEISIAAESHGAELNAFTDREATCFYGRFPADQSGPVTRLLAEVVSRPGFDPAELEKEKNVIAEEIRATEEDPEAQAVNLLFRAVYGEQPMGRPIAGTCGSLGQISRSHLFDFFRAHYGTGCSVVVAAGDVEHDQLVELLTPALTVNSGCRQPARQRAVVRPPASAVQSRPDISQVHVCMARPG
ncbi:MAG: pitrilysin family protein, partial [candidate division WOR-3 bacterium]